MAVTQHVDLTSVETFEILQSKFIQGCCTSAASALVLYDYLGTVARERELVWGRRLSRVVVLFHLNRWTLLVWATLNSGTMFLPSRTRISCDVISSINACLEVLLLLVWAAFSAIRIYAISGCSWWWTLPVCLLSLAPVAINIYQFFMPQQVRIVNVPVIGPTCVIILSVPEFAAVGFDIGIRIFFIASDILVLLVTCLKTYTLKRDAERINIRAPFAGILFRNGVSYFVAMLTFHIIDIAAYALSSAWVPSIFATIFLNPVMSITISHYHLSLRRMVYELDHISDSTPHPSSVLLRIDEQDHAELSSLRFASGTFDSAGHIENRSAIQHSDAIRLEGSGRCDGPDIKYTCLDA